MQWLGCQSNRQIYNYILSDIFLFLLLIIILRLNIKQINLLAMSESIRVLVRIRPLSTSEKERGCKTVTGVDQDNNQINLTKPEEQDNIKSFAYDAVFGESSQQALVYSKAAYELVEHVLQGYNGTVFAYGQTGCGKTHSMVGQPDDSLLQGIIPRSFGHILKKISDTSQKQFLLRCSFLQIYNEEIHDLLGDPKVKLQLKESPDKGVFVKDISQKQATTHHQLMQFLHQGNKNRIVGETAMNKQSSRSHLLFALHLQSAAGDGPDKKYIASRLNLVDLAGSQRLSKTGAVGQRLKEAQKINLSLSALGNVISALVQGRSQHIPYRDSKLTRLLQDSLGGNTKTVMVANCSPADYNYEETLSTLRYASRAKMIKNKPVINQDPKDALLKQYANQIEKLKHMIQGNGPSPHGDLPDLHNKLKEKQVQLENQKTQKANLLEKIKELQSRHIEGKNVSVDPSIIESLREISLLATKAIKPPIKQKCSIFIDQSEIIDQSMKNAGFSKFKKQQSNLVKDLKQKVKQLQRQVRDVGHQYYLDKQCLLEDVRSLNKQNKFLQNVLGMLLQNHQLQQIREASTYNEEKQQYKVPPFYIKNKELVFPKLQQQQSMDMIKQMHDRRHVLMDNQKDKENKQTLPRVREVKKRKSRDLDINEILKQARVEDAGLSCVFQTKRTNNKVKLEPLSKF